MRRLLLSALLLLLLATASEAAITVTARGTGTHNVSSSTLACSPATTLAAGSFGVLCVSLDNAGSAGAATVCGASMTDTVGNTWTRRQNGLFDNGEASAGVEIAIYTAQITTALAQGNTATVDFGGVSVTAKTYAFWQLSVGAGKVGAYVTGGLGTGAKTATPTVTTTSITSGDAVVGMLGFEGPATVTADTDISSGSWSTQQTTTVGAGTSGNNIATQVKVTNATATQTYNPTLSIAPDTMMAWISVDEATPAAGGYRRAIGH